MSRLYDFNYNEDQWKISGSRDIGYTFVNKKTSSSCVISKAGIIGVEQISDDNFLVLRSLDIDELEIVRFKIDTVNTQTYQLYRKEFQYFEFLTKDLIIFNKDNHVFGATLYSISKNREYDTLNHLFGSEPDCKLIKGREIELVYENPEKDEYPTALYVEYNFSSYHLDICAYLQVILDVNTFKPIGPVYSTLRDKYFYIDDTTTLEQIAKEDSHYARIINDFLVELYSKDNRKDVNELVNMKKQ
ncbi:MAG: hypothetical protein HFJ42_08315 [Clostridia bacterium]|nr:hypothetical protein [Clostridia bacterium]